MLSPSFSLGLVVDTGTHENVQTQAHVRHAIPKLQLGVGGGHRNTRERANTSTRASCYPQASAWGWWWTTEHTRTCKHKQTCVMLSPSFSLGLVVDTGTHENVQTQAHVRHAIPKLQLGVGGGHRNTRERANTSTRAPCYHQASAWGPSEVGTD